MLLDLHAHSIKSDDGRAKVENYCQWIHKRSIPIDGFVLTEHRQFDAGHVPVGLGTVLSEIRTAREQLRLPDDQPDPEPVQEPVPV